MKIINRKLFTSSFCVKSLKFAVFYTYCIAQYGPATFQLLNSRTWLVSIVLGITERGVIICREKLLLRILHGCCVLPPRSLKMSGFLSFCDISKH